MKSIFTIKATLSFNIINNKMIGIKIFKNYQNPRDDFLTLEEVRTRIEELTTDLKGNESYYRRHQSGVLTKEQREEILLETEMQDEIDFYESQIGFYESRGISDEEDIKKYVNKMAASHFNNHEEDEEQDEEPHYHINDYCDPYLGRESPPIPMSESDSDEGEPESKIDSLEKKLDGVENVVYQLLGGIFNQSTQSNMLAAHLCCLRGSEYQGEIDEKTIWPTTRQGYQHEEEIKLLKQQVSKLEDTVALLINVIKTQIGVNIDISNK
jgi:hypothetical protein